MVILVLVSVQNSEPTWRCVNTVRRENCRKNSGFVIGGDIMAFVMEGRCRGRCTFVPAVMVAESPKVSCITAFFIFSGLLSVFFSALTAELCVFVCACVRLHQEAACCVHICVCVFPRSFCLLC